MARIVYATVLITLAGILVGCQPGGAYLVPDRVRPTNVYVPAGAAETELVEEMAISRDGYEKGLEQLVSYYSRAGNNMKLEMAQKELREFQAIPRYQYVLGPAPGTYQATTPVADADDLFYEAQELEKQGRRTGGRMLADKNRLRLAHQRYDQLIRDYPSSDKVDDAAFFAGVIMDDFAEYVLALEYYRKAFQSDPETPYPARFKAAYILDKHMHRYAEALALYNEALRTEAMFDRHRQWKEFTEERVRELQKLDEGQN